MLRGPSRDEAQNASEACSLKYPGLLACEIGNIAGPLVVELKASAIAAGTSSDDVVSRLLV